jgi:hypothetical protein
MQSSCTDSEESRPPISSIERRERIRAVGLNPDDPDEVLAFDRREQMSSGEKFLAVLTLARLL